MELLWTLCISLSYPWRGTHYLCGAAFVCPSQCFLHAMQAACSCRPPHSCSLPSLDTSFPGPGSVISETGECLLLLWKLQQTLLLSYSRNKVKTRVKRWDSSCFREEILPQFWLQTTGRWGGMPGEIQLWFCLICILIPALLPPFFLLKTRLLHRWTYGVTIHGFSHVPLMNYLSKGTGGDFFGFTEFFHN